MLIEILLRDDAVTHPMVVGELACGTPPTPRARTLNDIGLLGFCAQANFQEVLSFIERDRLYGLGCGLIDLTLLTSALITPGTQLWTLDNRLSELARRYNVAFDT